MTTENNITRAKTLKLLRRGLLTLSEAAELAGVSRQLVRHWAKRAGVDVMVARWAHLRKLWKR